VDEFTMPIRTEFGTLTHTCRFLPDSLMDTSESGETFGYRATIMARAEVIPSDYMAASDLIVALPDWINWAGLLDRTATAEMPLVLNPIGALFTTGTEGAWYEPARLTTVTRDTAGATPITGYGQTIGRIVDASGRGNHAVQATSGSRPLIARAPKGGVRNLLQRTQELDNAFWTKTRSSVTANALQAPDGSTTAEKLVEDGTATQTHYLNSGYVASAVLPTASVYLKAGERTTAQLQVIRDAGAGSASGILRVNLTTGAIISGTGTVVAAAGGWWRCSVTANVVATTDYGFRVSLDNGTTGTYSGDGASGFYVWGQQLEAGANATAYQRVDESMNVSELGGVVRNLLTWTQEIDNSAWTKSNLAVASTNNSAPDGTATAERLQITVNTSTSHVFRQTVTGLGSDTLQAGSLHAKQGEVRYLRVHIADDAASSTNHCRAEFDLQTGAVSGITNVGAGSGAAASAVAQADGSWRLIVAGTPGGGSANSRMEIYTLAAPGASAIYAGNIGDGFIAWGAQIESGSVASAYQRVDGTMNAVEDGKADTFRLVFDGVDDAMTTTFAASLGSACTVARAIPDVGAQILTSQVVGTTFSNTVSHAGLLIINRGLTADETAMVTGYLNKLAGVG
jgi:hypothetical protein